MVGGHCRLRERGNGGFWDRDVRRVGRQWKKRKRTVRSLDCTPSILQRRLCGSQGRRRIHLTPIESHDPARSSCLYSLPLGFLKEIDAMLSPLCRWKRGLRENLSSLWSQSTPRRGRTGAWPRIPGSPFSQVLLPKTRVLHEAGHREGAPDPRGRSPIGEREGLEARFFPRRDPNQPHLFVSLSSPTSQ